MKRDRKILIISGVTILYMIAAFSWWAVLLHRKNLEIYTAKKEILSLQKAENSNLNLQNITERYEGQSKMIWGESAFFMISLLLACWLLYRAFKKEIEISQNQKNFLLSVTHELKSPIASLLLAIDTIKRRNLNETTQNKLLDNAKEDAKRLENLVQNILFSTKLDSAYQFNFEKLKLIDFTHKIIKKFNQQIEPNFIQFVNPNMDSLEIICDREAIKSVIENLLHNAIKYSGDQDPKIELKLTKADGQVILKCIDHGIGIDESEKGKIFNKFYRVGNEDTRKTTGTGLGLYIVKQIVDAHNGSIDVKNNHPKGCIFSVKLPLKQKVQ